MIVQVMVMTIFVYSSANACSSEAVLVFMPVCKREGATVQMFKLARREYESALQRTRNDVFCQKVDTDVKKKIGL